MFRETVNNPTDAQTEWQILELLPSIEMAWADGHIQASERLVIHTLLGRVLSDRRQTQSGVSPRLAQQLVENLLSRRPSKQYFERCKQRAELLQWTPHRVKIHAGEIDAHTATAVNRSNEHDLLCDQAKNSSSTSKE